MTASPFVRETCISVSGCVFRVKRNVWKMYGIWEPGDAQCKSFLCVILRAFVTGGAVAIRHCRLKKRHFCVFRTPSFPQAHARHRFLHAAKPRELAAWEPTSE